MAVAVARSLRAALREYAGDHPGVSPEELAEGFMAEHGDESLVTLLVDEFMHVLRETTRAQEALALTVLPARGIKPKTRTEIALAVGGITSLWGRSYRIGDGVERRYEEMTRRDWLTRKALLEGQRRGIDAAISFCDRMVELLDQYGVDKAAELPERIEA